MIECYPIRNTAVATYSYIVDPNRPPITRYIEDSVCNKLFTNKSECEYELKDTLLFHPCLRNVRSICDVDTCFNCFRYNMTVRMNEGKMQQVLLVRGNYTVRIKYLNSRSQKRRYCYRTNFQRIVPLKPGIKEIKKVKVEPFEVSELCWEACRLYIELQTRLQINR